jgi:hypothetical protein
VLSLSLNILPQTVEVAPLVKKYVLKKIAQTLASVGEAAAVTLWMCGSLSVLNATYWLLILQTRK